MITTVHRSLTFIVTSMNTHRLWSMIIEKAMNVDRYHHWSYWFLHECAVDAMTVQLRATHAMHETHTTTQRKNLHMRECNNILGRPVQVYIMRFTISLQCTLHQNTGRLLSSELYYTLIQSYQTQRVSYNWPELMFCFGAKTIWTICTHLKVWCWNTVCA